MQSEKDRDASRGLGLSRKGAHIGELEEEIAHLAKESEVMMSKIAHQQRRELRIRSSFTI